MRKCLLVSAESSPTRVIEGAAIGLPRRFPRYEQDVGGHWFLVRRMFARVEFVREPSATQPGIGLWLTSTRFRYRSRPGGRACLRWPMHCGTLIAKRSLLLDLKPQPPRLDLARKEVCALALLVPSRARFESAPKHEPHPEAARLGAMISESLDKTLSNIVDGMERDRQLRQERVFSAFPESDPRRLLIDTIIGFASAELSDVSQRLGEADPFSRLAARLSLWFKQSTDFSRYGIPYAHDGWPVIYLVRRLADKLDVKGCEKIQRLIQIWSGGVEVERSEEGVEEIASLAPFFRWGEYRSSRRRASLGNLRSIGRRS